MAAKDIINLRESNIALKAEVEALRVELLQAQERSMLAEKKVAVLEESLTESTQLVSELQLQLQQQTVVMTSTSNGKIDNTISSHTNNSPILTLPETKQKVMKKVMKLVPKADSSHQHSSSASSPVPKNKTESNGSGSGLNEVLSTTSSPRQEGGSKKDNKLPSTGLNGNGETGNISGTNNDLDGVGEGGEWRRGRIRAVIKDGST